MQNGEPVDEPSMDEILSSIRRIIAEDDVGAPTARDDRPVALRGTGVKVDDEPLTLTDADEGDAGDPRELEVLELSAEDEGDEAAFDDDRSVPLDELIGDLAAEAPDELVDEDLPAASTLASPKAAATAPSPVESTAAALLDDVTAEVAGSALQRLAAAVTPGTATAGGSRSIEAFVAELLRPELKAWLDANLSTLVERIVEREIKKLVRDAQPE